MQEGEGAHDLEPSENRLRGHAVAAPLPLWERPERIARCVPGEGYVSARTTAVCGCGGTPLIGRRSRCKASAFNLDGGRRPPMPPSPTRGEGAPGLLRL